MNFSSSSLNIQQKVKMCVEQPLYTVDDLQTLQKIKRLIIESWRSAILLAVTAALIKAWAEWYIELMNCYPTHTNGKVIKDYVANYLMRESSTTLQ